MIGGSGWAQAFVVDERFGSWGNAIEVPGMATLDNHGFAKVISVSCASAGNCAAGGRYKDGSGNQAFVVDEKNGVWHHAIAGPALAALNAGGRFTVGRPPFTTYW